MFRKPLMFISLIALLGCIVSGCHRSGVEVWEDTKTAGRYMGKGMKTFFTGKNETQQMMTSDDFYQKNNEEFIPLRDDDLYQKIMVGDSHALRSIDAHTAIPQSKVEPGTGGIPGIEGFMDPTTDSQLAAIFHKIYFGYNEYVIEGQDNQKTVQKIANYMKSHPDLYIFVEGHCDERGSVAYNLALGSRRSNAIRNMIVKEGINPDKILTISYGKERPITSGNDETARRLNRRGDFKTYSTSGRYN
ncbi:OmpA family protein [Simkania negevensis]|uniref:OmpA family protein n=1 Tax=Simkania negevensis TaxID=83561 RepID=A0ABS3ASC2_9BACT|nr:OmpA family protein [Simkania negevensis]